MKGRELHLVDPQFVFVHGLEAFTAQYLQRGGYRLLKQLVLETDRFTGPVDDLAQLVNVLPQIVLSLTRRIQFGRQSLPFGFVDVSGFDSRYHRIDILTPDTSFHSPFQAGINHLGEAAQFATDLLSLLDEDSQDFVFRTLFVVEVVAEDFILGLKFPVDTSVTLLHSAGVPRNIKVEQVPAVGLKVETFTGRFSGDQDPDGVFSRI